MLCNKLPPDPVSWQDSYFSSWFYLAQWFSLLVLARCQLGGLQDSVLLHASLILTLRPVGKPGNVLVIAVAEGKNRQDQSGRICLPLLVTFSDAVFPSEVSWWSRAKVGGLYKVTWHGSWAGYHFDKLPKETTMKMITKVVLGLISWYLGKKK